MQYTRFQIFFLEYDAIFDNSYATGIAEMYIGTM